VIVSLLTYLPHIFLLTLEVFCLMSTAELGLRNVISPWNGRHYLGFVLDVVNDYLGWGVKTYRMLGGGELSSINVGLIENGGEKIIVRRKSEGVYSISGFPDDRDFEDFQNRANGLLDEILEK